MILNTQPTTANDIDAKSFAFQSTVGFSPESVAAMTALFARIYRNSGIAVARETGSNSIDACVALGVKPEVHFTAPIDEHGGTTITITDFGIGMSIETLAQNFGSFGNSTKAEDKDAIGGFGLGAKALIAIAHTFSVITTFEGQTWRGVYAQDESGMFVGHYHQIETRPQSGTEINASVTDPSDIMDFISGAKRLAYGMEPGTVTLNGEVLPSIYEDEKVVAKNKYGCAMINGESYMKAIVGGIIFDTNIRVPFPLYVHAPIGFLKPVPSRDYLMETPENATRLDSLRTKALDSLRKKVAKKVDAAETAIEAIRLINESPTVREIVGYKWNGIDLKKPIDVDDLNKDFPSLSVYSKAPGKGRMFMPTFSLTTLLDRPTVFFDGVDPTTNGTKLAQMVNSVIASSQYGNETVNVIFASEPVKSELLDLTGETGFITYTAKDVEDYKIVRSSSGLARSAQAYRVWDRSTEEWTDVPVTSLKDETVLRCDNYNRDESVTLIPFMPEEVRYIVCLKPRQQYSTLVSRTAKVVSLTDKEREAYYKALPMADRRAAAISLKARGRWTSDLARLPEDHELRVEYADLAACRNRRFPSWLRQFTVEDESIDIPENNVFDERYPLAHHFSSWGNQADFYSYIALADRDRAATAAAASAVA
jgi:hypothetical protein